MQAGIDPDLIDESSFQAVTSHQLGISIPSTASGEPEKYSDYIVQVLQSMLWRLGFTQVGAEIKIGIIPTQPFQAAADYAADEIDHKLVNYEQSYTDIYAKVRAEYNTFEVLMDGESKTYLEVENAKARDLHLATAKLDVSLLQYVESEAQVAAQRIAYMLGDRRAFYTIQLKQLFLTRANLAVSYDLTRKQLPGFPYVPGTDRTSQLSVVEVQKSTAGPILVLEDQQGIQDNSGGW